jgi:hypothetical protein
VLGAPVGSLVDIAKQGAAALELANGYTDFIEAARRRKPTTPAAEIQQNLFPPRIARIAGAQLAGTLSEAIGSISSRTATGRGWRSPTASATDRRPPDSEPPRSGRCARQAEPGENWRTRCR